MEVEKFMSINRKDAAGIIAAFKLANDLGNESLQLVTATGLESDAAEYRRLVGEFMGNSYLNLLRPAMTQFEGLDMPQLVRENHPTYQGPDPVKSAIDKFLFKAKSAIATFADVIRQAEADSSLRPGSLREIEAAVEKIDIFVAELAKKSP